MAERKKREPHKIIAAYQNLFRADCAEAQIVLEDLSQELYEHDLTFVDQNPNGTAFNEGKRYAILHIRRMLEKRPEPRPTEAISES